MARAAANRRPSLLIMLGVVMAAVLATHAVDLPVRVDGDLVVVRAEAGMRALATELADLAPAALARIDTDLTGLPHPRAIELRLVHAARSLAGVAPDGRRVPAWAVGVAFPDQRIVAVATRRGAQPVDVRRVMTHELAHMALATALSGRAPRWLDEGFAYLHSADYSWARTRTLTGMAWTGDRYLLFELADRFPPGENAADRAYAQAFDFVAFLAKRGRFVDHDDDGNRAPFRQLLALIATGRGVDDAALDAYGVRLEQLETEWWQAMRQRYVWSVVGLFTLGVWVVGAILLVLGWLRTRRAARRTLAAWGRAEDELDRAASLTGATARASPSDRSPDP